MNEIDLIREVEKRAILYDKSVSGFNKTKLRDDAWKEVQDILNVSESECKKRWRSLRDSFIKLQRTHGSRTRWPYLHAMRFLIPHVEPSFKQQSDRDDSDQEDELNKLKQIQADYTTHIQDSSKLGTDDEDSSPGIKKQRLNSTDEESACTCHRTDPDELFLLSCASQLKRLNSRQNAVARLKIQQALYEAEFGTPGELPYVTPASECSFENVESNDE